MPQGNGIAAIIRRASPLAVIENSSLIINENDARTTVAGGSKNLDHAISTASLQFTLPQSLISPRQPSNPARYRSGQDAAEAPINLLEDHLLKRIVADTVNRPLDEAEGHELARG